MTGILRLLPVLLLGVISLGSGSAGRAERAASRPASSSPVKLDVSRIYIEYNSSDNDLGFHVFLDGEDWREIAIVNPSGRIIFEVEGAGAFGRLGLTELFFEGAEPSLDDVPLERLLAMFPEGRYRFTGVTAAGERLTGQSRLSHAVPAGPSVSADVYPDTVIIKWDPVTEPPEGFPNREIAIAGYQVIVGSFQVTLPASAAEVTVPREFVASLAPGTHEFEVLAIEKNGNQTITAGSFETR